MNDATRLQEVLEPGEVVLWSARPEPLHFTRPTFMLYIVALPWTVFTFFWLRTVTGGFQWPAKTAPPIPWWMPWVAIWAGLLLLVAGLWMLSAPWWIWRRGRGTIQVLTDRRALVLDARGARKMQALTLRGKVDFRVTNAGEAVSDVDVVCPGGEGLLFRAVSQPDSIAGSLRNG